MVRVLAVAIVALLTIYCVVEVAQSRPNEVRRAPRWLWAAAAIMLPGIGSLAWLLLGRPTPQSRSLAESERRRLGPDDDPDFLRKLR